MKKIQVEVPEWEWSGELVELTVGDMFAAMEFSGAQMSLALLSLSLRNIDGTRAFTMEQLQAKPQADFPVVVHLMEQMAQLKEEAAKN